MTTGLSKLQAVFEQFRMSTRPKKENTSFAFSVGLTAFDKQ